MSQSPLSPGLQPHLRVAGLHTHIGAYHILRNVSFDVPAGQTTMLLGRNGAGKTTTLRSLMGLWRPGSGSLQFNPAGAAPVELAGLRTPDIAALGIAYVPENAGIFSELTVAENMLLAATRARRPADLDEARLDWIFGLFPALKTFWYHPAGKLSGGQKQMLAMGRALCEPRALLLVDEPSKGLSPAMVHRLIDALAEIKRQHTTLVLVEQNFSIAAAVGDTVAVMDNGSIVHTGAMAQLAEDDALQHRLLGFSLDAHQ